MSSEGYTYNQIQFQLQGYKSTAGLILLMSKTMMSNLNDEENILLIDCSAIVVALKRQCTAGSVDKMFYCSCCNRCCTNAEMLCCFYRVDKQ